MYSNTIWKCDASMKTQKENISIKMETDCHSTNWTEGLICLDKQGNKTGMCTIKSL